MNRLDRIEEFLQQMASLAQNNPNLFLGDMKNDSNIVYRFLTRIGVSEEYSRYDMSYLYAQLSMLNNRHQNVKHFEYRNNDGSIGTYFWPFSNRESEIVNSKNVPIKIYIPVSPDRLLGAMEMILDYIDRENICVNGKVGKHIRFDNIVLRVKDKNDAMKIQNFINNNKFIQEGLLPPNPFAISNNNIAYGGDMNFGNVSYNSSISNLIASYISLKKQKKELDNVNVSDFKKYVSEYYDNSFVKGLNTSFKSKNDDTVLSEAFSCEQLLISLDANSNFDDYLSHIDKMNDEKYRKDVLDRTKNSNLEKDILLYETKLKELIIKLSTNFKFRNKQDEIIPYIKQNYSDIIPPELVDAIVRYRSSSEDMYINIVIDDFVEKKKAIERAVLQNSNKYGYDNARMMLMNLDGMGYDINGNFIKVEKPFYKAVTSQNNARELIMENIHNVGECIETIKLQLIQEGYDISNINNNEDIYDIYISNIRKNYNIK